MYLKAQSNVKMWLKVIVSWYDNSNSSPKDLAVTSLWLLILPAVWSSAPPHLTWSGGGRSLQSCWLNASRNEGLCMTKLLQSSQSEITMTKLFVKYLLMEPIMTVTCTEAPYFSWQEGFNWLPFNRLSSFLSKLWIFAAYTIYKKQQQLKKVKNIYPWLSCIIR